MQQFSDISQADAANSISELLDNSPGGKLDRHRSEIANYRPFSQEHATKSVRGRFHGANVIELERVRSALGVGHLIAECLAAARSRYAIKRPIQAYFVILPRIRR